VLVWSDPVWKSDPIPWGNQLKAVFEAGVPVLVKMRFVAVEIVRIGQINVKLYLRRCFLLDVTLPAKKLCFWSGSNHYQQSQYIAWKV
jgi:hypothetical protein